MPSFKLEKIQSILKSMKLDAWLFYDFRGSNELALSILDIPKSSHLTRRFYYYVPAEGTPVKIVMGIEAGHLDHLPGKKLVYSSHTSLASHLGDTLRGVKKIAMEYSPFNAIPYVSKLDAGTFEFLKTFGVDIVSSGDLISLFNAVWTKQQYEDNMPVADALVEIVKKAFGYIKSEVKKNDSVTEYAVQQMIMKEFEARGFITDHPPIVGVNENSANPHYAPDENTFKDIHTGDFVLIDLWAQVNKEDAVWADITWVGYMGENVPEKYVKIFDIVAAARDAAFNLVKERFAEHKPVKGYEVDDAARHVIDEAGYGSNFIHRTGHSITTTLHGSGSHMDNFETRDERLIHTGTSFSIEPGIYLTGYFGVRSEIDVYITPEGKVISTGEIQKEIVPIMK
jgi:Xaa-Pro aminopeptidase